MGTSLPKAKTTRMVQSIDDVKISFTCTTLDSEFIPRQPIQHMVNERLINRLKQVII